MAGACSVLQEAGCALVGGHTAEGAELCLGFTINVRHVMTRFYFAARVFARSIECVHPPPSPSLLTTLITCCRLVGRVLRRKNECSTKEECDLATK